MSASTVCGVGSTMSRTRLCVRISNCSRDFLSMCGRSQHRVTFDVGRQRNRTANLRARALAPCSRSRGRTGPARDDRTPSGECVYFGPIHDVRSRLPSYLLYSTIEATTPAPTVRPPSRIAKRRPSSIAIGAIRFTVHRDIVARHHHLRAFRQHRSCPSRPSSGSRTADDSSRKTACDGRPRPSSGCSTRT